MAYISIKNLKKSYNVTRTEKQEVIKGINVEFNYGEFVALLGESGCGKSTFLNILAGLDFDYTGSIIIRNKFIRDFTEKDLDNYRKNQVGIVFQNFNLIKQMTAFENVMLPLALSELKPEERKKRAEELLEQVGLKEHMNKYPNQLSGGQKQRVSIARALAMNPAIILADEPTGNLDKEAADEVMKILKDIAVSGKLVICVTHSPKVANYCTRILNMDNGLIAKDESIKNYKTARTREDEPTKVKDIDKKEIFNLAKNNIKQSFKRSLLVTIALSIGICAFVIMFFLGSGLRSYVENEFSTGTNKLQINVEKSYGANFTTANIETIEALFDDVDYIEKGSIISDGKAEYNISGSSYNKFDVITSTYNDFQIKLFAGRLPSTNAADREIIISYSLANKLVNNSGNDIDGDNILGSVLNIKYNNGSVKGFTIAGVADDYYDSRDSAYMTLNSMEDLTGSKPVTNLLYVISKNVSSIDSIIEGLELVGYTATRNNTQAEELMGYIDLGSFILAAVAAISLLVSSIMIFIVMYISVIERTKEIGILRSLGTRRRDIKRIFITEAGIVGLSAGVIGCLAAIVIGVITNLSVNISTNIMSINPLYILLGIGVSFVVSILSSLGPSGNASGLDPIEALRSE